MAASFIGKPISLISHSDVRYRGILAGIDPTAATIQLSNVFSMGTESRRPPAEFIPPVSEPYQYIIFKAAEVKDLQVDPEPVVPRPDVHADPAVMASAPLASNNYSPYAPPAPAAMPPQMQPPVPQQQPPYAQRPPQQQGLPQQQQLQPQPHQMAPQPTVAQVAAGAAAQAAVAAAAPVMQQQQQQRRPNSVQTAATSLQNVERALGDLRVNDGGAITAAAVVSTSHHHHAGGERGGRGGRRGGGRGGHRHPDAPTEIKVPTTDFDFETMNAKFDKAALAASAGGKSGGTPGVNPNAGPLSAAAAGVVQTPDAVAAEEGSSEGVKDKSPAAYNPQKSFFDTLSSNSSTNAMEGGGRGGRGRRGGAGPSGNGGGHGSAGGRNRREEEREKNVATFGEPGGVGLMGPGAYVGGWGGYGRRGGGGRGRGRGGRGGGGHGPRVGDNQTVAARG